MDENNELLMYIYQNCDMGVKSCTTLINILNGKDNKIKKIVEGELKGYENYLKKAEKLLKKYKIEPKDKGIMADIMSKTTILQIRKLTQFLIQTMTYRLMSSFVVKTVVMVVHVEKNVIKNVVGLVELNVEISALADVETEKPVC